MRYYAYQEKGEKFRIKYEQNTNLAAMVLQWSWVHTSLSPIAT